MYCPKCGAQNYDNAVQCTSCGTMLNNNGFNNGGFPPSNMPNVPNYLVWSILATLFCCLPLGIPAIVFSSQVDSKLHMGDYAGAQESSRKAKMFCWISFGLGLGVIILYILIFVFSAATISNIR